MHLLPEYALTRTDTIHCTDALTLLRALPDESVDIVVTSPPYNLQWKSRTSYGIFAGHKWIDDFQYGYDTYHDHMPEDRYQRWIRGVVTECLRVSKGLVWINHKTRYRNGEGIHPLSFMPFPLWSEVVWDRGGSLTLNARRFAPSHEYLFGFGRPHYWDDHFNLAMTVWRINVEFGSDHPAPYPEGLITRLIEASCPPGGVVLDPFMGSGTTAAAAQKLNRHYIGCDLSRRYVEDARQRLAQPYTLPLFAAVGE